MYYVVNFPYYAAVEHVLPYVVVQLTKNVPYELKVGRQHAITTVSMHQKAGRKGALQYDWFAHHINVMV